MPSEQYSSSRPPYDAFDLLRSYRRRLVLAVVSDASGPVSLSRVATRVAAAEAGKPATSVTSDERDRNEIHLYHADVPALVEAGLVEYDPERRTVESDDLPLEGEEWLEMPVVEALDSWNRHD